MKGVRSLINLEFKGNKPIYEQIIEGIKLNVMRRYLKPGDAIPSVRKLALDLKITPGTVAKAYQELERQGVIETIRGKGTFIAEKLEIRADEERLDAVRQKLKSPIMELKMMGYDKKLLKEFVSSIYDEL
jgi:GntR family transcriptional regulator